MESHQPANYTSDGPNFTREDNRLLHFDPEVHMQGAHCDLVAPSACCEEGPGVLPSHRSAEESMASSPLSSSTARWMLPTIPPTPATHTCVQLGISAGLVPVVSHEENSLVIPG